MRGSAWEKGDALYATELPDGIKLSPYDPKLAKQMEVAERVMRKRRTLLRKRRTLLRKRAAS